jgi:hypothetical protein
VLGTASFAVSMIANASSSIRRRSRYAFWRQAFEQ